MSITSVKFKNFKALRNYSVSLQRMNVLVGPNNSGKSTVLSAFRVLEQSLRRARSRKASLVKTPTGTVSWGHNIPENMVPISLENVHSGYTKSDSRIEVRYSRGNKIHLLFPVEGGVKMSWETAQRPPTTPAAFRKAFPEVVQTIPVLGPIEQHESVVTDETVRRAAGTPAASRHFRNYWRKNPDGFDDFRRLVENTWPGMSIQQPERLDPLRDQLTMFVSENRIDRELYWSGLGFQIWCQLLTHISRCAGSDLLVVDEPEVYLHPEVQRQLLGILREVRPDIVLATHSVEILSEADPSEILLVDKALQSARRLRDIEGVQQALDNIGSIQNLTLTELARNRRILFVESLHDYKTIRRFAKILGFDELAAGSGLTAIALGGFDSWTKIKAFAWGFKSTLGAELSIVAIFDRDYRCEEELTRLKGQLEEEIEFAHFHGRKELENYLLSPEILHRASTKAVEDRARRSGGSPEDGVDIVNILESITDSLKEKCSGQYISKYCAYFKSTGRDPATLTTEALRIFEEKWDVMQSRLEIVAGKEVLRAVRDRLQDSHGITLTDVRILDCYKAAEVPEDLAALIRRLEVFRSVAVD
ncbi:MAG: AAA family ATPase [Acidobacteria bacterium]|nr:AAA family ATPase [Acidobacteriota bacterium]MYJ04571.1 AAA family ATPase [Acidobacteriota bacterium]